MVENSGTRSGAAIDTLERRELQRPCRQCGLEARGAADTLRDALKHVVLGGAARGDSTTHASVRGTARKRSSKRRSPSPVHLAPAVAAPLRDARRLSRDTSLAYLVPAVTAAYLQLPNWQYRCAGFALAAFFALIHHSYELEHGKMSLVLNRVDIFFAVSAAAVEIAAEPPTVPRATGAAVAATSWLYQKFCCISGTPEQVYAHIGWHVVSSGVAAALMIYGA